ncbi:transforming growth factor beta regulator 1 [Stylonychia lemnae]|uniref:Transforming growth factor beta regulator 1 n=1 Tax=Stylonychia lemnae TaxID=5949 RepID=A0A078B8A9_STYLE|nr:transforming growth factor beta regulator 1 [Stylonychia lemnae]|eukprot:CDW90426.1 transforming growth factor beta regulator 1 [Stylonychia lemnae]
MSIMDTFYAKFQSVGEASVFVRYMPCLIGSESVLKARLQQSNGVNPQSQNFTINMEDKDIQSDSVLVEIIQKNEINSRNHLILRYNIDKEFYEIMALKMMQINDKEISMLDGFIQVNSMDKVYIPCNKCYMPHLYYFILPIRENISQQFKDGAMNQQKTSATNNQTTNVDEKLSQMMKKTPDKILQQKWGSMEKETLKKHLLLFGYGRWRKIRKYSKCHDKILKDKSDVEMKAFANDFIRTLFEYLQNEKNELKTFLINLIDEKPEDPFVQSQPKEWGEQISQRAAPWAKRIQLLYRVKGLVQTYKGERKKYFTKPEIEQDPFIKKEYETWNNLLNFLPAQVFYGQRPSVWWTLRHDIDLLFGTYKYGYAMYQSMRSDTSLSFHKSEQVESQYQEFPNADNITRRLKKLVQIIGKSEYQSNLCFEKPLNALEPTGFTLEDKNMIYETLINFGVPVNSDGKNDYGFLRSQLMKIQTDSGVVNTNQNMNLGNNDDQNKDAERNTAQNLERFIQRLRMESQKIIQAKNAIVDVDSDVNQDQLMREESKGEEIPTTKNKNVIFDPDEDGYNFGYEKACILHKNMNILQFIRKTLLPNNCKQFEVGLEALQEQFQKERLQLENMEEDFSMQDLKSSQLLPDNWICEKHDKNLLIALNYNGFEFLKNLSGNREYGFEDIEISYDLAFKRIEEICEFYKDYQQQSRVVKKPKKEILPQNQNTEGQLQQQQSFSEPKRKIAKVQVQRNDDGIIEYERSQYHTEKNLFPIGFKSLREHNSQTRLGERCQYICEILDGGSKPQYRVTPQDDPENSITRDSSTGCWIDICKKINELQGNKRSTVTVSGPERFGLADVNVIKLMQQLPNANKCQRYQYRADI